MLKRLSACSTALLLLSLLALNGCTCGFDCSNGDDDDDDGGDGGTETTSLFSLSLSDSLPEELQEVFIEVQSVTLRRSDGDDKVFTTFVDPDDPNSPAMETIGLNLLDYRGARQFKLIRDLEVEKATYNDIELEFVTGESRGSYVRETAGRQLPLAVTNDRLNLTGIRVSEDTEAYTIEFELARALDFEVSNEVYRLGKEGVRVVEDSRAATLSGTVDNELFDTDPECEVKDEPEVGNRVYLYEGNGLNRDDLADVFIDSEASGAPEDAIAPFAVASLIQNQETRAWEYKFGFLPSGNYTLAFSCNAEDDENDRFDENVAVPLPLEQVREVILEDAELAQCNFKEGSTGC